jgi:zinc protease
VRTPAGSIHESQAESGLAYLTARALLRGADGRSFDEINLQTDQIGSSLTVDAGRQFVEMRVRCLSDDLPEMIDLVAAVLLRPDFPEDEVQRVRAEQLGAIAEADNDTRASADRILRRAVYPLPNPLGSRILGSSEIVSGFAADRARAFHAEVYGPGGTSVAVVGGMGELAQVTERLASAFGSWQPPAKEVRSPDLAKTNEGPERVTEAIDGKSQADIAAGTTTIARGHPDYYALDVANLILGRLGLMGRLGAEVRDRQGLAYYAFSQLEPRSDGSLWVARAGVDPGNIDRTLEAIAAELERLRTTLVSAEELADAKQYLIGVLPLALESHDGVASTLLAIEDFGLGLDYLARYPAIIDRITAEDVRGAAARHLDPERLGVGIAGPPG